MPRLSVIVISYNMAREIPRTILSLSARMQRGIAEEDYEILLIDNGSTRPFDEAQCRAIAGNLRILSLPDAGPSPVRAINLGLAEARGELAGVFIDGARMASPGLLRTALAASMTHPRPVIGTLAFHLGPDVQYKSIHQGYNQAVEDTLLAQSGWESDGYRLFDISVFAGSSQAGWFTLPLETNALFLKRAQWTELGGFDEGFVSAGGGLVNLDTWARACQLPDAQVLFLLGEATFHQFHGGVATNATVSPSKLFHEEYVRLRGRRFEGPRVPFLLFGSLDHIPHEGLQHSLDQRKRAS